MSLENSGFVKFKTSTTDAKDIYIRASSIVALHQYGSRDDVSRIFINSGQHFFISHAPEDALRLIQKVESQGG